MDSRDLENGLRIPCENYCDQPYVVLLQSGEWLCVMTTGRGLESTPGQHVVSTTSADHGRRWTDPVDIEPAGELMSSWATPLRVPSGRVYAFYCYDFDGKATSAGGWLAYRFTDDGGRSWSTRRHRVPLRVTERDRTNCSGGRYQYFWSIDKPIITGGRALFALTKLESGSRITGGEGWVASSDNVLTEPDPDRIRWELLPEGDSGVRRDSFGDIQEEYNVEALSDGTLYMVHRTAQGTIGWATSSDGGRSWTDPEVLRDRTGRPVRNPRACPRLWKAPNGKFLLWHHNNGFPGWGNSPVRSPAWVSGGVEEEGVVRWSQPEVLLYTRDQTLRGMSYPDFICDGGRYWITETQKFEARVHEVDTQLLEALWQQHEIRTRTDRSLICEIPGAGSKSPLAAGARFEIPRVPDLDPGSLTVELGFILASHRPGQALFDTFGPQRQGIRISTNENRSLRIEISDGQSRRWTDVVDTPTPGESARAVPHTTWDADAGFLEDGRRHHAVFVVDGAARLIMIVLDGVLSDGGVERIQGWWRTNPCIRRIQHDTVCSVASDLDGQVELVRVYDRALTVTESIGNYRAYTRR